MNFIAWIILGGFAGWLASVFTGKSRRMGKILNILTGVIGATIGGWIYNFFGSEGVTGFNWHSFWVATVGAVVLLVALKIIRH